MISVEKLDYDSLLVTKLASKLYKGGQVALELKINIPSGASSDDLKFEAIPDLQTKPYYMKLCAIRLTTVGKNLPCMEQTASLVGNYDMVHYNKSAVDSTFNDLGHVPVGPTCPANIPGLPQDNEVIAQMVYQLPPQDTITSGTFNFHGGLRDSSSTIWVASSTFDVQTAAYTGNVVSGNDKDRKGPSLRHLESPGAKTQASTGRTVSRSFLLFCLLPVLASA